LLKQDTQLDGIQEGDGGGVEGIQFTHVLLLCGNQGCIPFLAIGHRRTRSGRQK
jgi:hypothetical protein